jgi:hypothetical protein
VIWFAWSLTGVFAILAAITGYNWWDRCEDNDLYREVNARSRERYTRLVAVYRESREAALRDRLANFYHGIGYRFGDALPPTLDEYREKLACRWHRDTETTLENL